MKKTFKKIVAAIATAAMAFAAVVSVKTTAVKAADGDITLYCQLASGVTAAEIGVNVWGNNVSVENTSGDTVACWGTQMKPQLDPAGQGWGSITLHNPSGVEGLQFVYGENVLTGGNCWNAEIPTAGVSTVYLCTDGANSGKWYKEASFTTEIAPPVLDEVFYLLGTLNQLGANAWTISDAPQLIETPQGSGTYVLVLENVPAGNYQYKILQDPADFGWTYAYGDGELGTSSNYELTVAEAGSTVTVTVTAENADVTGTTVVVTAPESNNNGNTENGNTENGNTENGNTENGNTENGNTENGNTNNGNTNNGNTENGNTENGNTVNGNTNETVDVNGGVASTVPFVAIAVIAGVAVVSVFAKRRAQEI